MRLRAIVVATALIALTRPALAQTVETRTVRVDYTAPAECPPRTWFEGALHFRSERVLPVSATSDAAYDANIDVVTRPDGYHASLRMTPASGEPTIREIDGARCTTVIEALAFTAALLLDPEGVNTATLPSDVELTQIAESARAKATPPPAPSPPPPPVVAPPPEAPPPRRPLGIFGELGAGAWNAVDGLGMRGHLGAEIRYAWSDAFAPYARLGAFVEPPGEGSSRFGTIAYVPTGGRVDLGALARLAGNVRVGGGAHFTTLVMPVDAPSADEPLPSLRVVPSAGLAARAAWQPSSIGLVLEGAGGAHIVRETFNIATRDDAARSGQVFRLPALYVQATLGVLVSFGDLRGPFGR